MKPFDNPLPKVGGLLHPLGPRDSREVLSLSRLEADGQRRALCAAKDAVSDFLEIVFKVCQIVRIPELRQLFNGIRVR